MRIFSAIQKRVSTFNPDHRAIFRGMVYVAAFVFVGKLAGAAKEMAIAYRYGVSNEIDAYLFMFNLVSWPISVWLSIITTILVPLATHIRQDAMADLPRFRAELLAFSLVFGCNLSLIAWFGLPVLLHSSWVGLSSSTLSIAIEIVPYMVALIPLGILVGLFSAWTLSSGRHANTLLESVPALAILVTLLSMTHEGVNPLVWGTLAGFVCHVVCLLVPLAWKNEIEIPKFTSHATQWPIFWQGFSILLAGQTLTSFSGIVDQFFAAHLDTGSIATLSYSNRILALIIGLGATAVSRATLPVFSRIKSQEGKQLQKIALFWVLVMIVLGICLQIFSWCLAPWMVKSIFERGAFTARNTEVVTEVFRYGLIQLPFYFSGLVLVSLLASHRKYHLIAISGITNLLVKSGANYVLIPLMGINGIVMATGVMYMFSLAQLYWFVHIFLKKNEVGT